MITSTRKDNHNKENLRSRERLLHLMFDETPEETSYWNAFKDGQQEAWEAVKQVVEWASTNKDITTSEQFKSFLDSWLATDDVTSTVAKIQTESDKKDLESKIKYLDAVANTRYEKGDIDGASINSKLSRWLKELKMYRDRDSN